MEEFGTHHLNNHHKNENLHFICILFGLFNVFYMHLVKLHFKLCVTKSPYSRHVEYGDLLFDSCIKALSGIIEEIQLEAARTATGAKRRFGHIISECIPQRGWGVLSLSH